MDLHIASAIFEATYCFVLPLRKAKFSGVPSRALVKLECAVCKKVAGLWLMGTLTPTLITHLCCILSIVNAYGVVHRLPL
jgi:hypothetical protein